MLTLKWESTFLFTHLDTNVTLLLEAGANFKHIQKRLGHTKLATTMDIYSHVTDNMITETVELFEQKAKLPTL